jgi:hypothetical protein
MLKITDKKRAAGTMDQQVKMIVSQICRLWDDLANFERLFALKIKEIKQINHVRAEHAYRLKKCGQHITEVWHICTETAENDRLLSVVEYVPEEISE